MILLVDCGKIWAMNICFRPGPFFSRLVSVAIVLSIFCFAWTNVFADPYADGLRKAKAEDKPMVLYFYSNYCGYCDRMEKEVLADKDVSNTIKTSLVFLRINVDKQSDLAYKYNIRGYPTTWLLEPSGKRIVQVPGYIPKKDYKLVLAYAKGRHYRNIRLGEFLNKSGVN
jgi:thioredoxin-related protein